MDSHRKVFETWRSVARQHEFSESNRARHMQPCQRCKLSHMMQYCDAWRLWSLLVQLGLQHPSQSGIPSRACLVSSHDKCLTMSYACADA